MARQNSRDMPMNITTDNISTNSVTSEALCSPVCHNVTDGRAIIKTSRRESQAAKSP